MVSLETIKEILPTTNLEKFIFTLASHIANTVTFLSTVTSVGRFINTGVSWSKSKVGSP
jgi:hypothetical protein